MKLIDLEMLRRANQSKEGHPRGVSSDVERKGPLLFRGLRCQPVLDLGGRGLPKPTALRPRVRTLGRWAAMLNMGEPGLSSSGSRGQRQCSGVLMSDLQKNGRRGGGGGAEGGMEEVRKN